MNYLAQGFFQSLNRAVVKIRLRISQVAQRGRFERCGHPTKESVIALTGAAQRGCFQVDEIPEAQIGLARPLTRRVFAELGRGAARRRGSRNGQRRELAITMNAVVIELADPFVMK